MAQGFVQKDNYTPDRLVTPHLLALAGCVETKLSESGIATCYGGIVTGEGIDGSEIGDSGALWWVRLANMTVAAPGQNAGSTLTCTPVMLVNVGVGYMTCYPIDEDGKALSEEQQLGLSDIVNAAMMALYRGMACCDWAKDAKLGIGQRTVVTWTPQGPQGGVLGGEWLLQFEILRMRPEPISEEP